MSRRILGSLSLALGLTLLLAQSLIGPLSAPRPSASASGTTVSSAQRAAVAASYGQLPLAFELNAGQADASVRFLAHGSGYTLALTPSQALLSLAQPSPAASTHDRFALPGQPRLTPSSASPPALVGMQWLGANPHPVVTGEQPLPGTVNYFIGNDPAQWHTNIPTYQQVRLHNVYPGVDLVYYGTNGQLEYDFVVAPGANPDAIQFGFTGDERRGVDLAGNLSLALPGGSIAQGKPLVYQTVSGARQPVTGGYALASNGRVGFALGAYNPRLPLIIDPAYKFSTYLGGNSLDFGTGIVVDASGNAYITGHTDSPNFPIANAFQPYLPQDGPGVWAENAFVTKLNAAGTALIYSTFLGGNAIDGATSIAVDSSGAAYITGYAQSTNFPTTPGAYQTTYHHIFVSKFSASGSTLVYSTYLGGSSGYDYAYGIALNGGNAYVTGYTQSADFPTTPGVFQGTYGGSGDDAFITQFNASGSGLVYSTYLHGNNSTDAFGIAVDASGNAYVTGATNSTAYPTTTGAFQTIYGGNPNDAFATKVNATGTALVYSTYLGGPGDDEGLSVAVDASGNAYLTGETASTNFPVANALQANSAGGWDVYVTKLNPGGTGAIYSTYLGGANYDFGQAITADASGNAYVTGYTESTDFPTANPLQASMTVPSGSGDAFVSKLNATGSALLYSSYLGGSNFPGGLGDDEGYGIAVGKDAAIYITGFADSTNFPVVNAYQATNGGGTNVFITKIGSLPSVDTTTGVFRPSNGALYLKNSNSTGYADITLTYGLPGDKPVTGDWTGKGYNSIGVDRAGKFYLRNTNTTGYADITLAFGNSTDLPVTGDWTGKGYDSVGVFRNGVFYLRNTNTTGGPDLTVYFGAAGDLPVVGDWTGKGYDSIGVYRPSTGTFYLRNTNTSGAPDIVVTFGASGDLPIAGDWTAKGYDSIGLYRNGTYFLRNSNTTGAPDITFTLGVPGDQPIAGPWLAPASAPPPVHRGPSAPVAHAAGALPPRWAMPGKR